MPEHDAVILIESIRLLEYWGFILRQGDPRDGNYLWLKVCYDNPRHDTTAYQIRHFGLPYEPKVWIGRIPTEAERQGVSRAVKRLAESDLLEPVARYGTRTSHFRLTPKGLEAAVKLLDPGDTDLEAIGIALRHCLWGTAEHVAAVETKTGRQ